jgi:hypothetical protein
LTAQVRCSYNAEKKSNQVLALAIMVAINTTMLRTRLWYDLVETAFGGGVKSGIRRSVLCWCVWQESSFSHREYVCTFYLRRKTIANFFTFNSICKDKTAIKCITVQHKTFAPFKFDG